MSRRKKIALAVVLLVLAGLLPPVVFLATGYPDLARLYVFPWSAPYVRSE